MLKLDRRLIILILALAVPFGSSAQNYVFNTLTPNDGFPSRVNDIFVEDYGYAWAASNEGLVRISNSDFRIFTHSEDPKSIPSNKVFKVTADSNGTIWALTDKGLARYSPKEDRFSTATADVDGDGRDVVIWSMYPTGDGFIAGSANSLYRYSDGNAGLKLLKEFMPGTDYPVNAMFRWDEVRILLHSNGSEPLLYNLETNEVERTPFDFPNTSSVIFVDSRGRLWRSSYNRGLECYDHIGNLIRRYDTDGGQLKSDIVLTIAENGGEIWVGTDGGGISIISSEGESIRTLIHERDDSSYLPADTIQSLFCDDDGNIWAGRIRGGLIFIKKSFIQSYLSGANQYRSKSEGITAIFQTDYEKDCIWIGTEGSGIIRFTPSSGEFRYYPDTEGLKIYDITGFDRGKLLLSTIAEGFFLFDTASGICRSITGPVPELEEFIRYSGTGVPMHKDKAGRILFSYDNICRYEVGSGRAEIFPMPSRKSDGMLFGVFGPGGEQYSHNDNTLFLWDVQSEMISPLVNIGTDEHINSTCTDREGNIWMATENGIGVFDLKDGKYKPVDSFFLKGSQSICCDGMGRIWVGTQKGLFIYYPEEENVVALSETDGARENEYINHARLVTRDGDLYFGGVRGLLRINQQIDFDFNDIPEIVLTDVSVNGDRIPDYSDLRLRADYKSLTLDVFAKEGQLFRSREFRFRIKGPKTDDIVLSDKPELTISQNDYGKYTIYAACTTTSGKWTEWAEILDFRVNSRWYLSWWFLGLVLAVITAGVSLYLLYYFKKRHETAIREYDKERIRFLVNVSHELRTPLTLVLGPLGRIIKEMPEDDPNYRQLSNINKQALRMKYLLNTVLTAHKIEEGASSLNMKPHNLNEWMVQTVNGFKDEAGGRNISIRTIQSPEIEGIDFDEEKCQIVLSNILMNALKHSPEHSTITVSSKLTEDRDMVRISVSDQGDGIGMKDTSKLFERFYQETEDKSGFGIGLSYCKTIVEQHNGHIGAENNEDRGATFYFELPVQHSETEAKDRRPRRKVQVQPAARTPKTSLKEANILLVDDNMDFRDYIRSEIESKVRSIIVAGNGKDAYDILQAENVDVILSDVMMPVMDGFELCQKVKANSFMTGIPIILLTARSDENSRLLGYQNGADGYLVKPFETDVLIRMLTELIKKE